MTALRCLRRWNTFSRRLLHALLPTPCLGCGRKLRGGEEWLCAACAAELRFEPRVLTGETTDHWDAAAAVFAYTPAVRAMIHALKYDECTRLASFLGEYAVRFLHEIRPFERIDLITAVPLHPTRKRARGYNQSLLLARAVADGLNVPLVESLVRRQRYTSSQTHLDREGRQANVSGAFERGSGEDLAGKHVLVIDDVFTTGATTAAVAAALKTGAYEPARQVYVLTIARA